MVKSFLKGGGIMSKVKHTPGPWKVIEKDLSIRTKNFDLPQCGQGDCNGQIIASVDPTGWARGCREDVIPTMQANARLISAAPELLEACKFIENHLNNLENGLPEDDAITMIRKTTHKKLHDKLQQAIAKAEKE